jgi:hypothetical protein
MSCHFFGIRGAVDAIAVAAQIDPNHADRVIGAGLDFEGSLRLDGREGIVGVVNIGRVAGDLSDLERARWRRRVAPANSGRENRDELARLVDRPHLLVRLEHFNLVDLRQGALRYIED